MILTRRNVQQTHIGHFEPTPEAIAIARTAMDHLWHERCHERGESAGDRAGSCKFAALVARNLFGGRLAGNLNHVFVILPNGQRLDLNDDQPDVVAMGLQAHALLCIVLTHVEYRQSLSSCMARAARWSNWAAQQITEHLDCSKRDSKHEAVAVQPNAPDLVISEPGVGAHEPPRRSELRLG